MKVSIIVKAEPDDLLHLIPCLDGQTYSPYEILLLCDERTNNWLRNLNRPKKTIRAIYQNATIQTAVLYSTGDLLCFLDADTMCDPDFLSHWVGMFKIQPDVYAIGPGVTMVQRYNYIRCGGLEGLSDDLLRVDNTNLVTTRSILNVSGYL